MNLFSSQTDKDEANPPNWPDSVILIDPEYSAEKIRSMVAKTEDSIAEGATNVERPDSDEIIFTPGRHFVDERYVILFKPGTYKGFDVEVGYYSQLLGLGAKADDVLFTDCNYGPYVPATRKNQWIPAEGPWRRPGLSLDTFWRAAENFKTEARNGMLWAVSQAAPLRRVHIAKNNTESGGDNDNSGNLLLHDAGAMASGGHVANAFIEGSVSLGSQQQFCFRSVSFANKFPKENLGAWSFMFVDCENAPDARDGVTSKPFNGNHNPSATLEIPLVTVEKPFIVLNDDGKYDLHVPAPRIRTPENNKALGSSLEGSDNDSIRPFEKVKVAKATKSNPFSSKRVPDYDVARKINAALKEGKDVVLTPGMFYLTEPIEICAENQVILGLGLATLVAPKDGRPCIIVPPCMEGVRIAGIMLEANVLNKTDPDMESCFIQWGEVGNAGEDPGKPENPGCLSDVFARVGGSNLDRTVSTNVMVRIDSGHVYGDNLWLWRADHVKLAEGEPPNIPGLDFHQVLIGECPCETGIVVNGNDVTIHGLAVEHTTENNTIWNGERGKVMFYQNELPYDVDASFGEKGFVGYKVADHVKSHLAKSIGVYSNFRDYEVPVATGITHPETEGVTIINPFSVWLDNKGSILSVINGKGDPLEQKGNVKRYVPPPSRGKKKNPNEMKGSDKCSSGCICM